MAKTDRYGKYSITKTCVDPRRNFEWEFVHDDYDGPPDPRCGYGQSLEDCIDQIMDLEDDDVRDLEESVLNPAKEH